ncbi:MAG: SCP2 sterol-binding domain-containing protein [Cocleimonas sp.]
MNIPLPVLSAIETALNAWLKLDGESLAKCEALDGKIIRLHITGLDLNLFFMPAVSGIQVMANYPDSALADDQDNNTIIYGEVDATIHGSPMALMRLSTADNAGASMLESDVEIDGDMRVAEKFSAILKDVDIDWEELLSKLVGDIIAHQAGQVVRSGREWFSETVEAMKLNTSEYLSEEAKVTPADAEINYFMDQVDDVRMDIDRLEARVKNLQSSIQEQSQEPQSRKEEK